MQNWSIFGMSQTGYVASVIFYIVIIFLAIFLPIYFLVINKSLSSSSTPTTQQLIAETQQSIASTKQSINNIRSRLTIPGLSSSQIEFLNAQLTNLEQILAIQINNLESLIASLQ